MSLFKRIYEVLSDDTQENQEIQPITQDAYTDYACDFITSHQNTVSVDRKEVKVNGRIETESGTANEIFMGEWARNIIQDEKSSIDPTVYFGYATVDPVDLKPLGYPRSDFDKHAYISGKTGSGKSTLIINLIVQFMMYNNNFVFITPKNDDVLRVLQSLPEEELEKTDIIRPGDSSIEKTVGYNLFDLNIDKDNEMYDQFVQSKVDTFISMLISKFDTGARLEPVSRTVVRAMILSENQYNIADFITFIADEEAREQFVKDNQEEDIFTPQYISQIKEFEQDDLDPIYRRIKDIDEKPEYRQMFYKRESDIDFQEYVSGDRNLIVDLSIIDDMTVYALMILREMWDAAQRRGQTTSEAERDIVALFMDEFQDIITEANYEHSKAQHILKRARQQKLSLITASQHPKQMPRAIQEEIQGNTKVKVPLQTGEYAKFMSNGFTTVGNQSVSASDITDLQYYQSFVQPDKNKPPVRIDNFPRYPPLRTESKAADIRSNIIEARGSEKLPDKNAGQISIITGTDESSTPDVEDDKEGEEDELWLITRAIDIAQRYKAYTDNEYTHDTQPKAKYISKELMETVLESFNKSYNYNDLDQFIENYNYYFDQISTENGVLIGLSEKGEELASFQDSGSSASGGGDDHRKMLLDSRSILPQYGISVKVPQQEGEMSDAYGFKFADNIPEVAEKLFNNVSDAIYLEAESTTLNEKPKQTLKNLAKIMKKGYKTVFIIRSESDAKKNEKRFVENNGYSRIYDNGEKRMYNKNEILSKSTVRGTKIHPVRPRDNTTKTSVWVVREDETGSNEYIIKDNEQREHATLTLEEIVNDEWDKSDFPAYYYKNDGGEFIVKQDGDVVGKYTTENAMKKEWMYIKEPSLPEYHFANTGYPDQSDLTHLVIEEGDKYGNRGDVYIYEQGERYYLERPSIKKETSQTESPKSNTEHIKESDEVWTKPEQGDDEYNPAKDGNNFQGTEDEYHHESGDGGLAREEEKENGMDDYEIPTVEDDSEEKNEDDSEEESLFEDF